MGFLCYIHGSWIYYYRHAYIIYIIYICGIILNPHIISMDQTLHGLLSSSLMGVPMYFKCDHHHVHSPRITCPIPIVHPLDNHLHMHYYKRYQKSSSVTRSWPKNLYFKKVDHLPIKINKMYNLGTKSSR